MPDDDLQTTVNDDVAAAFDSVEEAAGEVMPEVDDAPKPEDGLGNLEGSAGAEDAPVDAGTAGSAQAEMLDVAWTAGRWSGCSRRKPKP